MGRIQIVNGDLLKAEETYLVHQVNCCGVMGKGLALQIRNKYPDVYRRYQIYCEEHRIRDLIGRVLLIPTDDGKVICNLFAQERYGNDKRYTDLVALRSCFQKLIKIVPVYEHIAMPYMIGCGNGGGDWQSVYGLIQNEFTKHDVALYKL